MNHYGLARYPGGWWPDPVTGVAQPTTIDVVERLERSSDFRAYTVVHRCSYSGRILRERTFRANSYMGTPDNPCGSVESSEARKLGREWYEEGQTA